MPIMDLDKTRYVLCSHLGIASELSGQAPVPDEEVALPVAVANDEDEEDVAGPTVEACVKLAKTIGAYLYIPNHCQILIYLCRTVGQHQHTGK